MARIRPNRIPAFYNAILDIRIVSKIYIIQNNRILNYAVISNECLLEKN